ncbi:ABC transporter permease [Streptomonospora litoralis]|uniref:Transport permease protein n=1 Tax=Streptomonospora litoralis TaxID=2498135 RepID=A0A4V0ZJH8_9ACTN|nr:ABC transporter permease [Streptomonospora litoralis]QBI53532.1 Daunorubicin/doxorubicin resistance ABC transporter permease protein DrrB [Streptomonospora litoralis]
MSAWAPAAPAPAEPPPTRGGSFLHDTWTVFLREAAPVVREPAGLAFTMVQPLLFLFFFGPLIGGSGTFPGGQSPWQWFVPGVLVMMCLFGPMMSGYNLLVELLGGSLERLLVSPLNRTAMLIGRTLKESAVLAAQAVLIVALAVPLGFDLHPVGVLAGLGLLTVFAVGLGTLSFVLAMASQPNGELFYGITQMLLFPLLLLSGVLLPLDSGPAWLRGAAAVNPVAYIADAERALFAGRFAEASVLHGALAAAAVAALGLALGTRSMRRGV